MTRNHIIYAIEDYCNRYEIEITADEILTAADHLDEEIAYWEEFYERCGIHSVNVDILFDNYFDGWEGDQNVEEI